ncbi:MAG: hypothetical protein RBS39_05755 [Phycisphaerales bacterium]|jgi:hypothetical protein|nr:hypothetical protein [Phycisphaerales bacterium]
MTPQMEALGPDLVDRTLDDATGGPVRAASDRLRSIMPVSVPPSRREDLIAAFEERLAATIDGEYERDLRAKIARGMDSPPDPAAEEPRRVWEKWSSWTRGASIGPERIEVRDILSRGQRIAPSGVAEGFAMSVFSKTGKGAFPVPADPVASRSDVVEVRLPMAIRPVRGDDPGAVLVGFQFVWSAAREHWLPLENVIYHSGRATYAAIPF